jgi:hypothetical protein
MSAAGKTTVRVGLFGNVSAVDEVTMSVAIAAGAPAGRSSGLRIADDGSAGDVDGGVGWTVSVNVDVPAPAFVGVTKLSAPELTNVVGGN